MFKRRFYRGREPEEWISRNPAKVAYLRREEREKKYPLARASAAAKKSTFYRAAGRTNVIIAIRWGSSSKSIFKIDFPPTARSHAGSAEVF